MSLYRADTKRPKVRGPLSPAQEAVETAEAPLPQLAPSETPFASPDAPEEQVGTAPAAPRWYLATDGRCDHAYNQVLETCLMLPCSLCLHRVGNRNGSDWPLNLAPTAQSNEMVLKATKWHKALSA